MDLQSVAVKQFVGRMRFVYTEKQLTGVHTKHTFTDPQKKDKKRKRDEPGKEDILSASVEYLRTLMKELDDVRCTTSMSCTNIM